MLNIRLKSIKDRLKKYSWSFLIPSVFLLYAKAINFDSLTWDDDKNIFKNPWVMNGEFLNFWRQPYQGLFVPLISSIWTALYQVSSSPQLFHLFNISVHITNTLLVFAIVERLLRERNAKASAVAFTCSLLFAIHPLQVETVAWITGGRDLTAVFFGLLGVWILVSKSNSQWLYGAIGFLCFCAGLLCKPTIAFLPVALIGLTFILSEGKTRFVYLLRLSPWLIAALISGLGTRQIQLDRTQSILQDLSLSQRLLISLDALGFYLEKILLPLNLASDYGRSPSAVLSLQLWVRSLLFIIFFILCFWQFRIRNKNSKNACRDIFAACSFFVISLTPLLGFIPFQAQAISTTSDRYLYLPMVGAAMACSLAFNQLKRQSLKVLTAILLLLALLTFNRLEIWQNDELFFADMWKKNPKSSGAAVNLGAHEIGLGHFDAGEIWLRRALEVKPDWAFPIANLASADYDQHKFDKIKTEILPILKNPDFLNKNAGEHPAMALLYHVAARVYAENNDFASSHASYCLSMFHDPSNLATVAEFKQFQTDMSEHNVNLPDCATHQDR